MRIPNIYKRTYIAIHFNETLRQQIRILHNPKIQFLDITSFTYDHQLKRIKNEHFTRVDHHNYSRNVNYINIINDYLYKNTRNSFVTKNKRKNTFNLIFL